MWFLFNKVADLNVFKKRLQNRCFLVNIPKFLRTPSFKSNCERLLLKKATELVD